MPDRVDFMIIGAQKSGTTTLAQLLSTHPKISFCRIKEPGYFSTVVDWDAELERYHALYDWGEPGLHGEASTMYTFLPEHQDTHRRLHAYNPDLKLIYIMRNPVERVLSNYTHRLVRGTVQAPPEEAIFARPEYLNRSRYGVQLRPYVELFGTDQLLLLIFEEYVHTPENTLAQIADFLGIEFAGFGQALASTRVAHRSIGEHHLTPFWENVRKAPAVDRLLGAFPSGLRAQLRRQVGRSIEQRPEISSATRALLWQFLLDDVVAVEQLLQRQVSVWRADYDA